MDNLTIEDVLIHYGANLTRTSLVGWSKVNCPFHGDSHASAGVNVDRNAFKCQACPIRGDPLNVIARAEHFGTDDRPDRKAANEWAEQIFGKGYRPVPRTTNGRGKSKKPRSNWRDRLLA
jgi:hypothetical protein